MKKHVKKTIAFALAVLTVASSLTVFASAKSSGETLSPALSIIASKNCALAKCGLAFSSVTFSEKDFAENIGIDHIDSITVLSLPDVATGTLLLGGLEVVKNQTIKAENLSALHFYPISNQPAECSFSFRVTGSQTYDIPCHIYVLDKENHNPTVLEASNRSLNIKTIRNIAVFETLSAYDPDGDELTYEITSFPTNGIAIMTDKYKGEYKYTPLTSYVGSDSLSYRACDKYGNYSEEKTVNITVESPYSNVVYDDLIGKKEQLAAIRLTDAQIIIGSKTEDGKLNFCPEAEVTREEFLAMAMKITGKTVSATKTKTDFADDEKISTEYKPYVVAAAQLGIVTGVSSGKNISFYPEKSITRAEACVILNNILKLGSINSQPVFEDKEDVPTWAEDAISIMTEYNILDVTSGNAEPNKTITRGEAALMLYEVMLLKNS